MPSWDATEVYIAEQHAMDPSQALAQVDARGVGDLITYGDRGLDVTYLPFVRIPGDSGPGVLTAHVARSNVQWRDVGPATWVVHGPDAYLSPSLVPPSPPGAPPAPTPTVPTWNYLVVHLRGRLIAHHDPDWKLQSLSDLVARHEPAWRLADGPLEAIKRLLPAIVGIEFIIDEVVGKAKLSQNRSADDLHSIAAALAADGHSAQTAEAMRRLALPYIQAREQRVAHARELKARRAPAVGQAPVSPAPDDSALTAASE